MKVRHHIHLELGWKMYKHSSCGHITGLPGEHVIRDQETQYKFVMGMNIGLVTAGVLASVLAIVHWYACVQKLFLEPETVAVEDSNSNEVQETNLS